MGRDIARNLIVRIGQVGCLIKVGSVVEICEQVADLIDFDRGDLDLDIVGAFRFRQTRIPVVDPALRLDLSSQLAAKDKTVLVLKSSEGNWGMLVDRVEEICPADSSLPCELPQLLKVPAMGYYTRVELFQGEPLVVLDTDQFYGSVAAPA